MADATKANERPLSPHLSIYRPLVNMMMSIIHRITGTALYFGTLLLAAWLIAIAQGPKAFDYVNGLFASPLGRLVLLGYTWALLHHMLGGLRHFIWDTGRGFNLGTVNLLSWLTIVGSIILTGLVWFVGLRLQGVL